MTLFENFLLTMFLIIGIAFFVILAVWIILSNANFGKKKKKIEPPKNPPTQDQYSTYYFNKHVGQFVRRKKQS